MRHKCGPPKLTPASILQRFLQLRFRELRQHHGAGGFCWGGCLLGIAATFVEMKGGGVSNKTKCFVFVFQVFLVGTFSLPSCLPTKNLGKCILT